MVKEDVSKYLIIVLCLPDELKVIFEQSLVFFCSVYTGEYHSFQTELGKDLSICTGVTEWIKLPANLRFDSKSLFNKSVALFKVTNYIGVVRTGFIC